MFLKISVLVSSDIRSALVETGEHLSPKSEPASIAPPTITGFIPIDFAIVIHITPIVAEVPKDVPIRNETRQLSKNVISTKISGVIKSIAEQIMKEIVPLERHDAVSSPMS